MRKTRRRRPTVSVATYCEDPLYPRIARAVAAILQRGTVVAPVDVLVGMGLLAPDHLVIREHVRRRRREAAACRWPAFWLEGATVEYLLPGAPLPPGRAARRKLVVLAEERQVFVPARAVKLADGVRRKWAEGLEVLAGVDEAVVTRLLADDEQGFLANMLVLVHEQPAAKALPRPSLEESYRRHEALVAGLAPPGEATRLPVAWHALWRLPSGMTWGEPGQASWMRYPAVSFVIAVWPLQPRSPGGGREATGAARAGAEKERGGSAP